MTTATVDSKIMEDVDLEVLVDLEQQFYDAGYADGYEHGAIHGRIEGRALGREKGFEMWEELGFYEGFAKLWRAVAERGNSDTNKENNKQDVRIVHTSKLLLDLIEQFPMQNPSYANNTEPETEDGVDILKLFGQIRSRYKLLCTLVGVRPSLRAVPGTTTTAATTSQPSSSRFEESVSDSAIENVSRMSTVDAVDGVSITMGAVRREEKQEVEKGEKEKDVNNYQQVKLKSVRRTNKKGSSSVWALEYAGADNPGGVDYSF